MKTAELASIQEDIEHALDKISKTVIALNTKAAAYSSLQKILAAKSQTICQEQAAKLEARLKPIQTLHGLISPRENMNTNLKSILSQIPEQSMGKSIFRKNTIGNRGTVATAASSASPASTASTATAASSASPATASTAPASATDVSE